MTDGAGRVNLEFCLASRSGAETGGGTIATFVICTGEREICGLAAFGAGGMIAPLSAGAVRERSRETVGAGATTRESSRGAINACSRDKFGAGAITVAVRVGAERG
jgi:hypothetical protein